MYSSTMGSFSATIGYVAPTPHHVHLLLQKSECVCVWLLLLKSIKCTTVQRGGFSSTIGYVAPSLTSEQVHNVQHSENSAP